MPRFDLISPGSATALVLIVMRLTGLLLIAPVFSARQVPMRLRTAVLLAFAVLLQPVARAHAATGLVITPAAALAELALGFGIGLGSAIVIGAATAAGDLMSQQIGLAGASVLDPMSNIQVPVLGQFSTTFATLLLLASGGHLLMIEALGESLSMLPIGADLDLAAGALAMAKLGGQLCALGVLFAAPAIAATMLANVALAVLTRVAPQLQILTVAFPLQIAAGLFTLATTLGLTAVWWSGWSDRHEGLMTRVLGPMLGAP
jgi:flagellar biosynthesis protein FliR